jgi:His-Xaa-Ser system protein HxsD
MFGEPGEAVGDERQLTIDTSLYGAEAVFRACYAFTDRCYLFLRPAGPAQIVVIFRKRQSPNTIDVLVSEFANELVNQRMRVHLAAETKAVREQIVAQAFAEADL